MDIKLILKGFLIGIGKIIPGFSGALLAISFNVYDKLINSITNFFSNKKTVDKTTVNKIFKLLFF